MNTCLSDNAVTNTSLGGHLRIECSARPDGTPVISKQDFRVPVHIGKGHIDQGVMVLNIANPTAGFFDGDHVDIDVDVKPGARLCLSTPAASRVFRTRSGRPAMVRQHFHVGDNARLEWNPEPFIPHAGACYHQQTTIDLDAGASVFFLEWIAPGRTAMGEVFLYQNLRWELDLHQSGRLIARERYDLNPRNHSLEALRARFPAAYYLSLFAAGDFARRWPDEALDALNNEHVYLGHGPLNGGARVVRALCADSVAARSLAATLRTILHQSAGLAAPALGRMPHAT
jgi:urease accessory protein